MNYSIVVKQNHSPSCNLYLKHSVDWYALRKSFPIFKGKANSFCRYGSVKMKILIPASASGK